MESEQYTRLVSVKVAEKLSSYHKPQTYQDQVIHLNLQVEQGECKQGGGREPKTGRSWRKRCWSLQRHETVVEVHLPAGQQPQT